MIRTIVIASLLVLAVTSFGQNGTCCDPDGFNYAGTACNGVGEPAGTYAEDGVACDPDCENYSVCVPGSECYSAGDSSCIIPIDGGLGLLAIAGGGLAIAAMRRRRDEVGQDIA